MSAELVTSTETVNSVNSSHLNQISARESAQLDTHTKTHFVFQNVCQDSETTDTEVVLNKVSLLDVHSHTSSNKALASQLATPELTPTPPPESVKPVHQTASHACHQLSVPAAAQVSTSRITSVSQEKDVPTTS